MRRLVRSVIFMVVATTAILTGPTLAAADAPEPWQPYPEGALSLPAERYCGDFDLLSTPIQQNVKSRVLERYSSGAPKVMEFTGLLRVEVTNLSSGQSVQANLSGHATVTFREDGSIEVYEMQGPIGMGWPQDDVYSRGFYLMNGYHVVEFAPNGHRTMLVDHGTETNFCDLLR
jgi:hypothetical protein